MSTALAQCGIIPEYSKYGTDLKGNTVAMYLCLRGIRVPRCWVHSKYYRNQWGNTLAMFLA